MIYLLFVSLLWAFSFGLIKGNLTSVDSNFVSFARLFISFVVFLPFFRPKLLNKKLLLSFLLIGSIQYGLMYVCYIYSFQFLKAYEIVLFTVFTPFYIIVINDLFTRKFNIYFYLTSLVSFVGTVIVVWNDLSSSNLIIGFILMQVSNLAFAFGQVFYKKIMLGNPQIKDNNIFTILFLGGSVTAFIFSLFTTNFNSISLSSTEILTLLYLGAIASGIGFFFWNYGAKLTNTGALAIFNNLKIPLGVAVSIIFFSESANFWNILLGGLLVVLALVMNELYIYKSHQKQSLANE